MVKSYKKEFPLLEPQGLYASQTSGDGNCLFNALSDQLYGTEEHHAELRRATIDYLYANKDAFIGFIDVTPNNATRRQPKRKNAGGYATKFDASMPDSDQIDREFERYIAEMSRGGTWAGNMELAAFAAAHQVNILVYQRDFRYQVSAPEAKGEVHIAYHDWQHYSSIRNISGPHSGPPELKIESAHPGMPSPAPRDTTIASASSGMSIDESEIKMVQASLNPPVSRETALKSLEDHHGNVNNAVDYLIQLQNAGSTSSSQTASVIDSSDSSVAVQKKKQDRRISRATKTLNREKKRTEIGRALERVSSDSLESLAKISPSRHAYRKSRIIDDSDDDWMPPPLKDSETSSSSEYSASPAPVSPQKIILKMGRTNNVPAKPNAKVSSISTKHLNSARDRKDMKKLVHKQDAKERKRLAVKNSQATSSQTTALSSDLEAPLMAKSSSHPGMTSGIQTLHI